MAPTYWVPSLSWAPFPSLGSLGRDRGPSSVVAMARSIHCRSPDTFSFTTILMGWDLGAYPSPDPAWRPVDSLTLL